MGVLPILSWSVLSFSISFSRLLCSVCSWTKTRRSRFLVFLPALFSSETVNTLYSLQIGSAGISKPWTALPQITWSGLKCQLLSFVMMRDSPGDESMLSWLAEEAKMCVPLHHKTNIRRLWNTTLIMRLQNHPDFARFQKQKNFTYFLFVLFNAKTNFNVVLMVQLHLGCCVMGDHGWDLKKKNLYIRALTLITFDLECLFHGNFAIFEEMHIFHYICF